jgi:predicted anti-sigma-YlaC factor YlaD
MTNWHVEDRLSAYLANEIAIEEKEFIESHLQICEMCRQELELLQELDIMLDSMPLEDPGPAFTDEVMARVKEEAARMKEIDSQVRNVRARFWKGSDFRNMVASVVAAFFLFQGFTGIVPKVTEMDSKITTYAVVTKVKIEIWVETVTRSLNW